jgi:ribonucleoside-diphosphate reductase alpha chain
MADNKLLEYFNGDDLAASVWQGKYQQDNEETPDDMHKRLAKEFAKVEEKYQVDENSLGDRNKKYEADMFLSKYGGNREDLTEESIYQFFKDFKYIIPQGSIMSQLGAKSIGSLSNCFVVGQPEDSYGGIFQKDEEMAQLMKRRGGVGIDISTLRPQGTATSNAAKSSTGAVSFMHRFSNTTREVAQNGRRGALMISIDINHPDVMEFIKIKRDLSQVTGANISIKLNDEFMKAVENDEDYILRFPCTQDISYFSEDYIKAEYGKLHYIEDYKNDNSIIYTKTIKAREYWDEIIKSAHNVAEPGLMFWGSMIDYSPDGVYPQFRQITTNPCSEIGMQPYDACRLIAVNLYSFVENPFTDKAKFDFKKFYEINYEAMRLSDDLIDLEIEHIDRILYKIDQDPENWDVKKREHELWLKIKETAQASRRTGLGFTALGDTLAALGLKYDSDEALEIIEQIMNIKMESELDCTIDLSVLRGSFIGWDKSLEGSNCRKSFFFMYGNDFYRFLHVNFPNQFRRMLKLGRRNVSWSTVAPTGTVSLMTQTTSGIEPLFMPFHMRRKKVNPNDKDVRVDFTDQNGDTWQEYPVLHPKFEYWIKKQFNSNYPVIESIGMKIVDVSNNKEESFVSYNPKDFSKEELDELFEQSPWYNSTANDIDWIKRVKIQSIIQKYITHSISSTINLPNDVSEEEVSKIYLESWKQGLKGITVYRDGSRSGVLVSTNNNSNNEDNDGFNQHDAPKRPKELKADYYHATSKGRKYAVIVGLLEGKPYEVFAFEDPLEEKHIHGTIVKIKKGVYKFISDKYTIDNLQLSSEHSDEKLLTRWISLALRHGANPKYLVEQTEKSELEITAFAKVIARTLKRYIPNGEKSTMICQECGSENVIFQEGCQICQDCGSSKCG